MRPAALLVQGDARHLPLKDASVQCVVCSPPYWGLRDYGLPPLVWDEPEIGGCEHEWADRRYYTEKSAATTDGSAEAFSAAGEANAERLKKARWRQDSTCPRCGAWRGSLGLEPDPGLYVKHLVEIFREVRRVLRDDGTVWLNLGDSYAGSWSGNSMRPEGGSQRPGGPGFQPLDERVPARSGNVPSGLKPKDLIGIPWRVAFALQADGWWLRSGLPWLKRNPMPESTEDRPSSATEYVFLLSKSGKYFYDSIAVQRQGTSGPSDLRKMQEGLPRIGGKHRALDDPLSKASAATNIGRTRAVGSPMRQWRTADPWFDSLRDLLDGGEGLVSDEAGDPLALVINTEPFAGSHFAVFPRSLVAPMILAGTSECGACPVCGAPWQRVMERTGEPMADFKGSHFDTGKTGSRDGGDRTQPGDRVGQQSVGWRPSCSCGHAETVPCRVLDIFAGAGTVPLVAQNLGRVGIGVELKPEYLAMAAKRTVQGQLL